MEVRWRTAGILAAGVLLGVVVAAAAQRWWPARASAESAAPALTVPASAGSGAAVTAVRNADAEPPEATAPAACAFAPAVAARGAADGHFALHSALAANRGSDPAPFLAVAHEAAAQGRARDAEVAFIVACRVAAQTGAATAPVAEAQTRLAQHYGAVVRAEADPAVRTLLGQRLESLLASSAQAYATVLGEEASRTRLAQQRLDAFRQAAAEATAGTEPVAPAMATLGAAPRSLAQGLRGVGAPADLGDVDGNLTRLYAQARAVSKDPAGVQRRHEQALQRRQACADEACVRAWAAQRKRDLFAEF